MLQAAITIASDLGVNVHSAQKVHKRLARAAGLETELLRAIEFGDMDDLAKAVAKVRCTDWLRFIACFVISLNLRVNTSS